ncbi:uncharacterized protein DUF3618 [Microterricola gilva]|uniref:Uncharacterized protein DUF3618 n=1 Tax=Microterricola gilva TaxID=393267 RepID=A0A4V2GB59_9MICO|nr:DUF3618 domain-containing protein [Microterricola gilva]RZU66906.1 uncharacterized protein DUF3618 [Microterricola gilva]
MTATPESSATASSTAAAQQQAPRRSRAELQADAARARAELAATLDAIEDKLNVPKQIGLAADRTGARVRRMAAENPLALGAVALAAATAVGLGVWAIIRAVRN